MGGIPDKIGRLASLPYGVTRTAIDAGVTLGKSYFAGDPSAPDAPKLPPPAPDLADETVQRARQAARRKLLMGGLTGPLDLTGASTTAKLPGLTGT